MARKPSTAPLVAGVPATPNRLHKPLGLDELLAEVSNALARSDKDQACAFLGRYLRGLSKNWNPTDTDARIFDNISYEVAREFIEIAIREGYSNQDVALRAPMYFTEFFAIRYFEEAVGALLPDFDIGVPRGNIESLRDIDEKVLARTSKNGVKYVKLLEEFVTRLEKKLIGWGVGGVEAAVVARNVVGNFQMAAGPALNLDTSEQIDAAVEMAMAGILAGQRLTEIWGGTVHFRPHRAREDTSPSLPSSAPELWAERDRSKKETPVDFLRRVWGPYASLLYQDDIKRLGDHRLVKAVRRYCEDHPEVKASDVLPPPRRAKLENLRNSAAPGSAEEELAHIKLGSRRRVARHRERHPKPKP